MSEPIVRPIDPENARRPSLLSVNGGTYGRPGGLR